VSGADAVAAEEEAGFRGEEPRDRVILVQQLKEEDRARRRKAGICNGMALPVQA